MCLLCNFSGKITNDNVNSKEKEWLGGTGFDIDDILKPLKSNARQQYLGNSRYVAGQPSAQNR